MPKIKKLQQNSIILEHKKNNITNLTTEAYNNINLLENYEELQNLEREILAVFILQKEKMMEKKYV